jgi:hypothetical protein
MIYTVSNWYWLVGDTTNQVYSSASRAFVAFTDATYQAWLAAGGVPTNIDTLANLHEVLFVAGIPPFAPVTALQARRAMRAAGLYDSVLAAVNAAAATQPDVSDSWEYATVWRRTDSWIGTLGTQLGLTSDQIDALFIAADAL